VPPCRRKITEVDEGGLEITGERLEDANEFSYLGIVKDAAAGVERAVRARAECNKINEQTKVFHCR